MLHFGPAYNVCPNRRRGDAKSNALALEVFQHMRSEYPESYCALCAGEPARTDSDRYAELRLLVESWQSHTTGSSQTLAEWSHR